MNWFARHAFGSHLNGWLAVALVVLLLFALYVAVLRLAVGLFKRKNHTDESESDYWRIRGG